MRAALADELGGRRQWARRRARGRRHRGARCGAEPVTGGRGGQIFARPSSAVWTSPAASASGSEPRGRRLASAAASGATGTARLPSGRRRRAVVAEVPDGADLAVAAALEDRRARRLAAVRVACAASASTTACSCSVRPERRRGRDPGRPGSSAPAASSPPAATRSGSSARSSSAPTRRCRSYGDFGEPTDVFDPLVRRAARAGRCRCRAASADRPARPVGGTPTATLPSAAIRGTQLGCTARRSSSSPPRCSRSTPPGSSGTPSPARSSSTSSAIGLDEARRRLGRPGKHVVCP